MRDYLPDEMPPDDTQPEEWPWWWEAMASERMWRELMETDPEDPDLTDHPVLTYG